LSNKILSQDRHISEEEEEEQLVVDNETWRATRWKKFVHTLFYSSNSSDEQKKINCSFPR
jgi:hypothetical protein